MNLQFQRYLIERQLKAIARRPRRLSGRVVLRGRVFEYVDAASFAHSYREIFLDRVYHFLSENKSPRVLDCGANIGLATLYSKIAFPEAKVTAFEPDPDVRAVLARNLDSWQLNSVEVVPAAVGDRDGEVFFRQDHADGGRIDTAADGAGRIAVRMVDLRRWLSSRVDLLKMDVEGAEVDLLAACQSQLAAVDNLIVEYHDLDGQPQRLDELLHTLRAAGFRYHSFAKGSPVKPLAARCGPATTPQMIDVFATRRCVS